MKGNEVILKRSADKNVPKKFPLEKTILRPNLAGKSFSYEIVGLCPLFHEGKKKRRNNLLNTN